MDLWRSYLTVLYCRFCEVGSSACVAYAYSLQIRFKNTAAILAVVQRLLSNISCRRLLILHSDNSSWLLHLPGHLVLAARECFYWPEKLIFAGVINRILLLTLAGELSNLLLLLTGGFQLQKDFNLTCLYEKVTNPNLFELKSDKMLVFCIAKWQIFHFSNKVK